jgi:hypothetical protein
LFQRKRTCFSKHKDMWKHDMVMQLKLHDWLEKGERGKRWDWKSSKGTDLESSLYPIGRSMMGKKTSSVLERLYLKYKQGTSTRQEKTEDQNSKYRQELIYIFIYISLQHFKVSPIKVIMEGLEVK